MIKNEKRKVEDELLLIFISKINGNSLITDKIVAQITIAELHNNVIITTT